MIYWPYCTKCGKAGVGSNENWKSRISNYKSHINKKVKSYSIVKHFIDSFTDTDNLTKQLRFLSIDCVTNTQNSTKREIDDILIEKEKFLIGSSFTIHKGFKQLP